MRLPKKIIINGSLSSKYTCRLNDRERFYIDAAVRKKTGGSIRSPWMWYEYHEDWQNIIERLRSINSDGPLWCEQK